MFRMDNWYLQGWIYLGIILPLKLILPEWWGEENSIIENLQILWLLAGMVYCWRMRSSRSSMLEGNELKVWSAGSIYFFLLFMREISWGRVFFTTANGKMLQYAQMGLYGKLVHPLVGVLIIMALLFCYQAKIWRILQSVKLPIKSFILLLLFIALSWLGERGSIALLHGQVMEELAEFGAYMMMYYIVRDLGSRLQHNN